MRITRTGTSTTGHGIAVHHRDQWFDLSDVPGYADVTRISDLLGEAQSRKLTDALERHAAALTPVRPDQGLAPTVVDPGADIWGAGLNYRRHSQDLESEQPRSGPGSYLRPANCLIGNGDHIELPPQSRRVTAEAELGLVIGTTCKNVERADWRSVVGGVTAVVDMTAEDVIRENPRHIPWAKGFDTFCSVGPVLVTLDEFGDDDLTALRIATVRNGETIAAATPADMKFGLDRLVEYFSAGRTLEAGTVICTGTPGAAVIHAGDTVQAVVQDVGTLTHPVRQRGAGRHEERPSAFHSEGG
ncbi:fumarylacetoacetate hydrolase family protein [Streptomyces sp.]|uniref:fumarylacetoacetate hydrolase family protein n=1 Tax=Streptomyces sp. TaxID=1931 RepID=UPI002D3F31A9|nr:fumarylacetoacetate hydrolase family protein [Streptomyces sp.]HZF87751.1 fumarylacetoacetate hydrolase family protein [Streptomyces sp.]